VAPSISGTAQQGYTLAASAGTWSYAPNAYAYQWQDCSGGGTGCEAITGATSSDYVVGATDLGHTIAVTLSAINAGGAGTALSAPTAVVPVAAPANTTIPSISGTAQEGQSLSSLSGDWSGLPSDFSYQWEDCNGGGTGCEGIAGATASGYDASTGDVGDTLRVVVTATNAGGDGTARTAPSAVVEPAAPLDEQLPAISGVMAQGKVLTGSHGTWSGSSIGYTYQWKQCSSAGSSCAAILGAITSGYVAAGRDVGDTIRLVVTASNAGGSAAASSRAGALVLPAAPLDSLPPAIVGTAQEGQTLSASPGTWSGPSPAYGYQWEDCNGAGTGCEAITGATASSYVAAAGDVGDTLAVELTATNTGGTGAAVSGPSAVIAPAAPVDEVLPLISGTAQQGQTLSASTGTWSGPPTAYSYQWQDCWVADAICMAIVGDANASSYVVAPSDIGAAIGVVVTATDAGGATTAVSSPTAAAVVAAPANTVAPTISGTAQQGYTLSASAGLWTNAPTAYEYQWQDCDGMGANCVSIAGAITSSYVLAAADVGATISVVVTAGNAGGAGAATSSQSLVVAPTEAMGTLAPGVVFGIPSRGRTLSAVTCCSPVRGRRTGVPTVDMPVALTIVAWPAAVPGIRRPLAPRRATFR